MESWYGGCCANCKRQDRGAECEARDTDKSDFRVSIEPEVVDTTTSKGRSTKAPVSYKPVDGRETIAGREKAKEKANKTS